jgi:hypothetical protein
MKSPLINHQNDENVPPPTSSHGKFLSQKFGPGTPSSALMGGSKPPSSSLYNSGAAI